MQKVLRENRENNKMKEGKSNDKGSNQHEQGHNFDEHVLKLPEGRIRHCRVKKKRKDGRSSLNELQ